MADTERDFFSFEEALHELRLKEEELKRLVSEGEIRAFRDGETMRLRRKDVQELRQELNAGEVIDVGGTGEELVFEDDTDTTDAGLATQELASDLDTLIQEDVEDVGEFELDEEVEIETAPDEEFYERRRTVGTTAEAGEEHPGLVALMLLTSALLVLALPILISTTTDNVGGLARGIANAVGGVFGSPDIP